MKLKKIISITVIFMIAMVGYQVYGFHRLQEIDLKDEQKIRSLLDDISWGDISKVSQVKEMLERGMTHKQHKEYSDQLREAEKTGKYTNNQIGTEKAQQFRNLMHDIRQGKKDKVAEAQALIASISSKRLKEEFGRQLDLAVQDAEKRARAAKKSSEKHMHFLVHDIAQTANEVRDAIKDGRKIQEKQQSIELLAKSAEELSALFRRMKKSDEECQAKLQNIHTMFDVNASEFSTLRQKIDELSQFAQVEVREQGYTANSMKMDELNALRNNAHKAVNAIQQNVQNILAAE